MLPTLQRGADSSQQTEDLTVAVNNNHSTEENLDLFENHKETSEIQEKIPENAQATTVLAGAHNGLSCVISAFVRLAGGCDLDNFAEVKIPVRFMFVLLGPEDDKVDYHQIGRSFSTLMSDKIFLEFAYLAKVSLASRCFMLFACSSFLLVQLLAKSKRKNLQGGGYPFFR